MASVQLSAGPRVSVSPAAALVAMPSVAAAASRGRRGYRGLVVRAATVVSPKVRHSCAPLLFGRPVTSMVFWVSVRALLLLARCDLVPGFGSQCGSALKARGGA